MLKKDINIGDSVEALIKGKVIAKTSRHIIVSSHQFKNTIHHSQIIKKIGGREL